MRQIASTGARKPGFAFSFSFQARQQRTQAQARVKMAPRARSALAPPLCLLAAASLLVAAAAPARRRVHVGAGQPVAVRRLHERQRGDGARPVLLAAQVRSAVEAAVPLRRAPRRPDARAEPHRGVRRPDMGRAWRLQ